MKFRTKIWMLPASAAVVFVIGVAISYAIGANTSASLEQLRTVDAPYVKQVDDVDRRIEQFRTMLQSAAAEGDAAKLTEVETVAKAAHTSLAAAEQIAGKAQTVGELRGIFDQYQSAALGATRAMLTQGDVGDQVSRMQAAQAKLDEMMKKEIAQAAQATLDRQAEADSGVRTVIWVNLLTGLAVLSVLGAASFLTIRSVWAELGDEPDNLRRSMQRVAEGDLSVDVRTAVGDSTSLNAGVQQMVDKLREAIGQIRRATDSISTASSEIATGNQDLSVRTENTATNLQQTASSMEELTGTVRQSADSARQANQLASSAAGAAARGGSIVEQVVTNMDEINQSSRKITEIIGVIDGIAFQTNILALNAAVEAARAGEQGRGFAVVAGEVRTLAQRSAQAAREIKTLIGASSEKVDSGAKLVQDAGDAMKEIVTGVQRVTDIIAEISAAAAEQSTGIGSVNQSVTQLDQMTQQNAALVEESAAAADSLSEQASRLAQVVAAFRLDHHNAAQHEPLQALARPRPTQAAQAPQRPAIGKPAPATKAKLAKPKAADNAPRVAMSSSPQPSGNEASDDWETF